jgi:antitoxin VapB
MQTAKLFPNGASQAVRLPKEFRFQGDRVFIRRMGDAVVLMPYHAPWRTLFDSLERFSPDFAAENPSTRSSTPGPSL